METGRWNYAKRHGSWSAPVVRQVFEGEAAAEYAACHDAYWCCPRYGKGLTLFCRPICERAVEARMRALGTVATRPKRGM